MDQIGSVVQVSASFCIFHNAQQEVGVVVVGKNSVTAVKMKNSVQNQSRP